MSKLLLNKDEFFIANYTSDENVEIFKDYEQAAKESVNGEVYIAKLNPKNVYFEENLNEWNYKDNSELFTASPLKVNANYLNIINQLIENDLVRVDDNNNIIEKGIVYPKDSEDVKDNFGEIALIEGEKLISCKELSLYEQTELSRDLGLFEISASQEEIAILDQEVAKIDAEAEQKQSQSTRPKLG